MANQAKITSMITLLKTKMRLRRCACMVWICSMTEVMGFRLLFPAHG